MPPRRLFLQRGPIPAANMSAYDGQNREKYLPGVVLRGQIWYTDRESRAPPSKRGDDPKRRYGRCVMAKDQKILKRGEMDPQYCWNTADLYPDDGAWTEAFEAAKPLPEELAA